MKSGVRLSTSTTKRPEEEIRLIAEFWNQLRVSEELGATTWDVLGPLEQDTAEAISQCPPDLLRARAAFAEACFRISGYNPS